MAFQLPVSFPRPVEVTEVGNQNRARITRRRLDLRNVAVSGGFVVPQGSTWYLLGIRARFVASALVGNRFPLISISETDVDGNNIELMRAQIATQVASQEYRVYCSSTEDNSNDGTAINTTVWVAYRNIPNIPLLAGGEITFTIVSALLGDYIDANIWINEVTV